MDSIAKKDVASSSQERILGDNHTTVRDWNQSLILNLIRTRGSVSRADLTRLTGLTRGAVSNIVSRLVDERLVREISLGKSTGGRRPVMLKIAAELNLVGAIDVRSRLTTLAVADLSGHILTRVTISTELDDGEKFLMKCAQQLYSMLLQWNSFDKNVLGVGLVVPGTVSLDRSYILTANEVGWKNVSIHKAAKVFDLPFIVENDANAAALAERYFGDTQLRESFVSILLQSDNIGAGIHLKGALHRGNTGLAGEIAHSIIDPNGNPCTCGNRGCLSTIASSYSMVNRYKLSSHTPREVQIAPIQNLTSESMSRAVKLSWSIETDKPRQYHVYRHTSTPIPIDAAHQVGISSRPYFIDHPATDEIYYYTIVASDENNRRSEASEVVSQAVGKPNVLVKTEFDTYSLLESYNVESNGGPEVTEDGLIFGNDHGDHAAAMVWQGNIGNAEIRGRLVPMDSGIYDSCGVLFKVQDTNHWYCALLAYGSQLRGGKTLSLIRQSGDGDEWLAFYSMNIELGVEYEIKIEATQKWIKVKAWPVDEAEPGNWQISLRDDSGWKEGGVGFRCYGKEALAKSLYVEQIVSEETLPQSYVGGILDHDDPTLQLIIERARHDDLLAQRVISEAGHALGLSVYNMSLMLGLHNFFFAGPIVNEGWSLLGPAIQGKIDELSASSREIISINKSSLGRDASLLGAVSVASAYIFDYQPLSFDPPD